MFAELLARSSFSFLRGASHPHEVVERAVELELDAVCLTDLDGIYGTVRGWVHHKSLHGIEGPRLLRTAPTPGSRPVKTRYAMGAELTLALPRTDPNVPGVIPPEDEAITVALLVRDADGYANLCRILTASHAGRDKGISATEPAFLAEHAGGLHVLWIAPERPSRKASVKKRSEELGALLREHFPGRAALAVYRHRDGLDRSRERWARARADEFELPIVASARPSYHVRDRKPLADVLHCIRRGTTLDEAGTELDASSERYLRSEAEMRVLFSDHPEWVEESGRIARTLEFDFSELKYEFPCDLAEGETADEKLSRITWERARARSPHGISDEIRAQIEKELALIAKIEVAPYFLSILEVVEMARRRRILCQGRGSAANSAVCYYLGITSVDPEKTNLLFERFLSAERAEPPDIDVDFEHERREEVIQEIYERYGRDKAAMVSEVISYQSKSALREVGKVFGLSLEQIDRLSGTASWWSDLLDQEKKIREAGFDVSDARIRQVIALATQLRGFPRHLSIHVGGFVLSARSLHHVAPVEPARREGRTVIPWDKDDIDALRFFKMDVLGLGMLTAIRKTLELIHRETRPEEKFDPIEALAAIPKEDPATYDLVCRADTVGIFQIESRAQMAMLPRLKPREFYDLVIQVAIVRPGPIQGGMVHPFLRRRTYQEDVTYPHPKLEKILKRTLGVPLFQEQVMEIAIHGAGYTGGQADQLRRDMAAWKKNGRLLDHRDALLAGFEKNGISREFGEALFEQMKGFGDYGFPESHASSFALLVYASSWQKTHYPAHFLVSLLNSQPMGFYAPTTLVRDAQKRGVEVRDVSLERSEWDSTLEEGAIRLGLRLVQGVGEEAALRLVTARGERAFESIEDVRRRARLNQGEMRALAEAGAFERLAPGRRQALWQTAAPATPGLFAELDARENEVELPALRPVEQLLLDYEKKGLSVSDHPLRYYRGRLQKQGAVRASDIFYLRKGTRIKTAGLVLNRQRPATASGVVFLTIEDETGLVNLIVHSDVFDRYDHVARHAPLLYVEGEVERDDKLLGTNEVPVIHVLVRHMERLGRAAPKTLPKNVARDREPSARKDGEPNPTVDSTLHGLSRNFH